MKRSKRLFVLLLAVFMVLPTLNVYAIRHAKRDIPLNGIIVNNHIVYSDVHPYIKNNRTFVPIRFIAEELGYDVKWNGAQRKVTMTDDNTTVELTISSNKMLVNGKAIRLDAPAEIRDDRTFVPLRAIAEAFGEKVDFSGDYRAVFIGEQPKYNQYYPAVFYVQGRSPVITNYSINLATYKVCLNSTERRFETIYSLVDFVLDDLYYYKMNGYTENGVSSYKPNTVKTTVPNSRQLKDKYYIAPKSNSLEGSWYGPTTYLHFGDDYDCHKYTYITNLGNNKYKLVNRIILDSDPSSEVFTEQYAYYDKTLNTLEMEESHRTYGPTGFFADKNSFTYAGTLYLENNNTRLTQNFYGSVYHLNKY